MSGSDAANALRSMTGSGVGKGKRKITRLDRLFPSTLTPSQYAPVPSSTESVSDSNSRMSAACDGTSPCFRIL